jgi:hypothetical protein
MAMTGIRTHFSYCLMLAGLLSGLTACDGQKDDTPAPPAQESTQMRTPETPLPPAPPALPTLALPQRQHNADEPFFLRFLATGESFYNEIKLEDGILSHTYFEDTDQRCEQWVQSRPCWTENDLKTRSMHLSDKEIDKIYTALSDSAILDITENTLGGAKKGQRFYAQHLELRIGSIEKHLIYQSFPDASKKPAAFQRIEDLLSKYAETLPH